MNNVIEQNHRSIKSRYGGMKGFKSPFSAIIFCTVFEEIRQFFRRANKTRAERRTMFATRNNDFNKLVTESA